MDTLVKFCRVSYKEVCKKNYVIPDRVFLVVTDLPWYKSWFGLRATRLYFGDGVTPIKKLKPI